MIEDSVMFYLAAFQRKVEEKTPLLLREKWGENSERFKQLFR